MGTILCATRGGEESYCTQDQAIALAIEQGDTLVFLYVVDTHFLDNTAAPIMIDVEDELYNMGKFLLLMAQERAREQGVDAEKMGFVRLSSVLHLKSKQLRSSWVARAEKTVLFA